MLTHGNICSNVRACLVVLRASERASCLAWLPLSHILERMVEYSFFDGGVTINYAESVDTVAQTLQDVHPNVVVAGPRLYEKVYARVLESAATGSGLKRRIFQWAKRTGEAWTAHRLGGLPLPLAVRLREGIAGRPGFSQAAGGTRGRR